MNFLTNIFPDSKERYVLLPIVLIISIIAIFIAYYLSGGYFALSIVFPLISLILTVSKNVWSSDTPQTKIAKLSIAGIVLVVLGVSISPTITNVLIEPLYEIIPALKGHIPEIPLSLPVMFIASIAIVLINFAMRDSSAMNKHSNPLEKEFPERDYKTKLKSFCKILNDDLERIEREANWSSALFVPLEAEVEIRQATKISKKKRDLLIALKKEKKAKTFLVIGQPGSGKSVALRKLCRDLLNEVEKTGKVPVYVSLKEWSSEPWTKENPPSLEKFHQFVLQNLKNQGDRFTNDFLNVYFDRMVENGRVFFIFDSFDEIPAMLEDGDTSWILEEISIVIHKYLNGAHDSRGIVATRPYKRPSNQFSSKATIEILPLSERRISEAIKKYASIPQSSINELLSTRRDLLPIAKNPFYCALIVNYLQDNDYQLPQNRSDLFGSYIEKRLEECSEKIEEKWLSKEDVIEGCKQIANLMFNSENYGFEYPIAELQMDISTFEEDELKKIIEILVYSKIGRHSNTEKTLFTFVHKRFAEYFAVLSLLGNENNELLENIHNDGKWRDVLVLLAELEDEKKSYSIALYSWNKLVEAYNEIIKSGKTFSYRSIHGLRFLRDAYLSRKQVIADLQNNLDKYILLQLSSADTILEKKIAVECVGLLKEDSINLAILEALRQNNDWLSETALKSCFYLNNINPRLEKSLFIYLDSFPIFEFLRKFKTLLFSLSLSPLFTAPKRFLYVKLIDSLIILAFYICHAFYNPIGAVIYSFILFLKIENPLRKIESFSVRQVFYLRLRVVFVPFFAIWFTNFVNLLLYPFNYKILRWEVPDWLFILTLLYVIPLYQIYYYLIKYREYEEIIFKVVRFNREEILTLSINDEVKQAEILKPAEKIAIIDNAVSAVMPWVIIVFLLSVSILTIQALPENLRIYGYGLGIGILLIPHLYTFWGYVYVYQDFNLTKIFLNKKEFTRPAISEHFFELKTEKGRLNFVNQLSSMENAPTDEWIDKLPNFKNDAASIRLAQLEESWRNLDR